MNLQAHFRKKLGTGFFGGEGFVLQKLTGNGTAFLEIDGDIIEKTLAQMCIRDSQSPAFAGNNMVNTHISVLVGCIVKYNTFFTDFPCSFMQGVYYDVFKTFIQILIPVSYTHLDVYKRQYHIHRRRK